MKITLDRQSLCETVSHLLTTVSSKPLNPILDGIHLIADNDHVTLVSYNLETGMKKTLNATVYESGRIVITARLLNDIMRKLKGDLVTITVNERLVCTIESDTSTFNINGMSPYEFPDVPTITENNDFIIDGAVLRDMVNEVSFSLSKKEGDKPMYTGIFFDIKEDKFSLVALDGYRIAVRTENIKSEKENNFIVNGKAIGDAVRLIPESGAEVKLKIGRRQFSFETDGYTIVSHLIDGEYVDYNNIIPNAFTSNIKINTKEIYNILERISLIISAEQIVTPVKLTFEKEYLKFNCITAIGSAVDEMAIDFKGEPFQIGFNCKYLLEALKAAPTDEIVMLFNGTNAAMVMTGAEGEDFRYEIMPTRL